MNKETIAAIATGGNASAIAIIRISGEKTEEILKKIVRFENIKTNELKPRYFYLGTADFKNFHDEVMAVFFKAPFSYTGEDSAEIHCHGNSIIAGGILNECLRHGARLAECGEFTMRAYFNGKLDLTRAEAVNELITAESEAEIDSGYKMLKGSLYREIEKLQKQLVYEIARSEAAIDFPDEEIEEQEKNQIEDFLLMYISRIADLAETYNEGKFIKEGIKVAILGEPNVGKSMLLNALLGHDRAIVTDIAGTTRDTIEETFCYKGQKYILIDTAGIRKTDDKIEKIGIERSEAAAKEADLILAVSEGNSPFEIPFPKGKNVIYVKNKTDLLNENEKNQLNNASHIYISAKTGYNIEELKKLLGEIIKTDRVNYNGLVLTSVRHYNALIDTLKALTNAQVNLKDVTIDCTLSDLNLAYRCLGKITGVISSEEIIDEIFTKFCVGK